MVRECVRLDFDVDIVGKGKNAKRRIKPGSFEKDDFCEVDESWHAD